MGKQRTQSWTASVVRNQDFYDIVSRSGWGLSFPDWEMPRYEHPLDVPDDVLGRDTLSAVLSSREIPVADFMKIFHAGIVQKYCNSWESDVMKRYGYKSRRDIYSQMNACSVTLISEGATLEISPSYHDTLDGFRGFPADEARNVLISASAPPAEIGAAVRLAFERCGRAARLRSR